VRFTIAGTSKGPNSNRLKPKTGTVYDSAFLPSLVTLAETFFRVLGDKDEIGFTDLDETFLNSESHLTPPKCRFYIPGTVKL